METKLSVPLVALFSICIIMAACNNTTKNQNKMEQTHTNGHTATKYSCPMHPEVTGNKGDKCTKCGMELVAANEDHKYHIEWSVQPQSPDAGSPTELVLAFKENDKAVDLDIAHEMKVHLMAISEDLTWFRHIHPVEQQDGTYAIKETFPSGGKYLLFTDFKPKGAKSIVDKKEIIVKGAPKAETKLTTKWVSDVDGYTLTLENGKDFKTGRNQSLAVTIEKNGKRLSEQDIEQYLGASAHIVMVSEAQKDFLHIHPVSNDSYPIYAETQIEQEGLYRMWVQFKIEGKVHTADFTVQVEKGEKSEEHGAHSGHNH